MATQDTWIIAEQGVESMFSKANKAYDLTTGDISPEQQNEVDGIVNNLAEILSDYVFDNMPEPKGE
jgi:hypothetical protein